MFNIFSRRKESKNGGGIKQDAGQNPKKRTPQEVIFERGNLHRAEMGFQPTSDAAELGSIFLVKTAMDAIQTDGAMVHPESMDLNEACIGFAFTCFMAVPVLTALGDKEIDAEPNRFLVHVASSIYQFFDQDSQIAIFTKGTEIFQKATESGANSGAFREFTDQIDKLVMLYALTSSPDIKGALQNRYQAFRNLVTK